MSEDRRFRVVCEACDWQADATHPNSLVADAEADRHNERVHDGTDEADVEAVLPVTDGGTVEEIAPEDDRVDPRQLPKGYTPAVVVIRQAGPKFIANYETLSSGWLSVTQWDGQRVKLPPNRVASVSDVRTEYDQGGEVRRVANEHKREQGRAVYPDQVSGAPRREDADVDRGEGVRTDGGDLPEGFEPVHTSGEWYECDCGAEYRNEQAAEDCCTQERDD